MNVIERRMFKCSLERACPCYYVDYQVSVKGMSLSLFLNRTWFRIVIFETSRSTVKGSIVHHEVWSLKPRSYRLTNRQNQTLCLHGWLRLPTVNNENCTLTIGSPSWIPSCLRQCYVFWKKNGPQSTVDSQFLLEMDFTLENLVLVFGPLAPPFEGSWETKSGGFWASIPLQIVRITYEIQSTLDQDEVRQWDIQ